ncbi:hypothetical protein [Aquimarina algicola]|uniref:Uncharacterized protein n=1 Tax=Aquimarina algicola TaxID=2589995 RepID=A0A504J3R8_9FLAO|nr:hypothetical protein [Aquimarina algicola]TPN81330.1 hypothetical protein FHK87_25425 [Aquimarina algicola]
MSILRIIILGLAVTFVFNKSNAQKSVNDYKYVIIPKKFEFLSKEDQYQLNSMTKFLLNKYGFQTFMQGDDFPEDLKLNGCKALMANVQKNSGFLQTKLVVELKDCNANVIFASEEGKSREKEFRKAYQQALRNAFKSIGTLNYSYVGDKEQPVPATSSSNTAVTTSDNKAISTQENSATVNQVDTTKKTLSYTLNEEAYIFEKRDYGFEMFKQEEQKKSIGKIYKSNSNKSFIVKAGELSGTGYFDSYGNFILERINPVNDKLISDTFARQ